MGESIMAEAGNARKAAAAMRAKWQTGTGRLSISTTAGS
jgi:hypothetical protein